MDGSQTGTQSPHLGVRYADDLHSSWSRRPRRFPSFVRRWRWISLFVLLPTSLTATYFYGFAADQYESEARFVVRGPQSSGAAVGGLGQMLGFAGAMSTAQAESYSVSDYLESHDAVGTLNSKLGLVDIFRREEADPAARLWWENPPAERLLKYYRRMVSVLYSQETGITTLRVHSFRPEDSKAIAQTMLELGEQRVNELNERAIADTVRVAQIEVDKAETRVGDAQRALTAFRLKQQDINPEKTTTAQLTLIGRLQEQLAQSRAQLSGMGTNIRPDSPQYVTMQNRIRALENQIATESARLTGSNNAMAPVLADYEQLTLRREFAATSYTSALASLEAARQQVLKQQLFVVRVVEPNLPERALFPRATLTVVSVFLVSLVAYGIGWLVLAGVREHAA